MAANVTALTGAAALAATTRDPGYVAIALAMLINAVGRVVSLLRYRTHAARLTDNALTWLLHEVDGALYAAKRAASGHCVFAEPMRLRRTG